MGYKEDIYKEDIKIFATVSAVFALLIGGCVFAGVGCERKSCHQLADQTGKEVEFRFPAGCFVKMEQGWVPADQWRESDRSKP